ncbi:DUF2637 domain-containing protein [Streptomyces justiciae]|uniref:DUF2637 domain-containing protein n=1 Tax=Streptomyces justiciae TaxID=2780140 RepID=UPI002118A24D|nr:DUF2637 domain-containing protein [Streptomyces justiciae]MCW8376891.1 DUF2637 domain-containing protein [Streptomyces justiciae]
MSRSIRPDAVLVQAVIAGALSFAHLHDLAQAAGQTGWKAWAYPVSVDLLLVAAWRRLRIDGPSRLAWCWFLVALVASLGANVATAGFLDLDHPPALLRLGVAGWPALAFLGGTLLAHTPTPRTTTDGHAHASDAPDPATVTHAPEPESTSATEPVPALPEAPAAVAASAVQAPPALVAHARRLADDHRARTGSPIDLDTLRARLNVPPAMADAIAAQLT